MPKREDIKSILVIGSGPIVIGQACEFDYSGAQACKVLREEGYRVILVNSNPATIMTDPELADATYVEPITPAFVEKVYSAAERAYCDSHAHPEVHYATRFAAKEAVLKALGTGFSEGIGWLDVEVRRTSKGRPYVVLTGRAREVAREQGVREIPLSLSYTHTDAVACAMAITEESVAATERRRDPMEELTRQFKDARSLLDDLPGALAAG